jgi:alkyl sulfatase BDS1-like metallo-beta-lactamase superfamily hydrolase
LRNGISAGAPRKSIGAKMMRAMIIELVLDCLSIRLDSKHPTPADAGVLGGLSG